jgi:hypothetical protein
MNNLKRPSWFDVLPPSHQDAIITRVSELINAESKPEERAKDLSARFSLDSKQAAEISNVISSELFNLRKTNDQSAGGAGESKLKIKFKYNTDVSSMIGKDGEVGEILKAEQFATNDDKLLTAEDGPFHEYSLHQKVSDSSGLVHRLREHHVIKIIFFRSFLSFVILSKYPNVCVCVCTLP